MPTALHQHLRLSLFHVGRDSYRTLRLTAGKHVGWALSHVVAGDVWTETRGERAHAPAGAVMVHPPRLAYSEWADVPGTHEWLVFDAALAPTLDLLHQFPAPAVVRLRRPADWSGAFADLLQAWEGKDSAWRDWDGAALTAQLLRLLLADWRAGGGRPRSPALESPADRFAPVLRHMDARLDRKLSRADLAALVPLHPNAFDRAFRQAHGVAPLRMLREMRLARARHLLETTDDTLDAIASRCGLEDGAYLGRVFRRRFGQPPGAYREGVRGVRDVGRLLSGKA